MESGQNYWTRKLNGRFASGRMKRRSLLKGGGSLAAGAAGLMIVGCGDDDDEPASNSTATSTAGNSDTAQPQTTTESQSGQPQRGGTITSSDVWDTDTFDLLASRSVRNSGAGGFHYSRLFKFSVGDGQLSDGSMEGDLVADWEFADDTTLLLTLRDNAVWDEREPTSGRAVTADDVVASFDKYKELGVYAPDIFNSVNADSSLVSITAVDDKRIEMKLAFPDAQFLPTIAHPYNAWVMPLESMNGGFDPATEVRGSGPWILEDYRPAVGYTWRRNPNWHGGPDRPYADNFELKIIPDAAQVASQFSAGNILLPINIPAADKPVLYQDLDEVQALLTSPEGRGETLGFGVGAPFDDPRVRQAVSMLIDRDTLIDIFSGADELNSAGIEVNRYWNTPISPAFGPFWLDPKSDSFGPSSANFFHNVEEAKALLKAAGYEDGLDTQLTTLSGNQWGADWGQRAEALVAMLAEGGIRAELKTMEHPLYLSEFVRSDAQ